MLVSMLMSLCTSTTAVVQNGILEALGGAERTGCTAAWSCRHCVGPQKHHVCSRQNASSARHLASLSTRSVSLSLSPPLACQLSASQPFSTSLSLSLPHALPLSRRLFLYMFFFLRKRPHTVRDRTYAPPPNIHRRAPTMARPKRSSPAGALDRSVTTHARRATP